MGNLWSSGPPTQAISTAEAAELWTSIIDEADNTILFEKLESCLMTKFGESGEENENIRILLESLKGTRDVGFDQFVRVLEKAGEASCYFSLTESVKACWTLHSGGQWESGCLYFSQNVHKHIDAKLKPPTV